jgi:hypothetical protein
MKKAFVVMVMVLMVVMLSGCMKVLNCDVTVNNDLTGTWKAKVYSTEPISKSMIESSLKQNQLTGYTLNPIKDDIDYLENGKPQSMDGWEVVMNWTNPDELKKILAYMRTGGSGLIMNDKNAPPAPEPLTAAEDGTITVNFGKLQYNKLILNVKGDINPTSTQGKITGRTMEFAPNQEVSFQFKPSKMPNVNMTTVQIGAGGLILAVGGYYYIRRRMKPTAKEEAQKAAE